jgi:hypothetical protein
MLFSGGVNASNSCQCINPCHVVTFPRTLSNGALSYVDGFGEDKDVVTWYKIGINTANRVDEVTVLQRVGLLDTVRTLLIVF